MEMDYKRLTKTITNENGDIIPVCRFYGTQKCQTIHTPQNCPACPMMQVFIKQLAAFEDIYSPEVKDAQ